MTFEAYARDWLERQNFSKNILKTTRQSNGAVRHYRKWMLIEQGLYEEKTSFRAHSGDLDPYIINNETVPLKFVPFSEVMDTNDETTVSYVLKFKDGSVYRTNPS